MNATKVAITRANFNSENEEFKIEFIGKLINFFI